MLITISFGAVKQGAINNWHTNGVFWWSQGYRSEMVLHQMGLQFQGNCQGCCAQSLTCWQRFEGLNIQELQKDSPTCASESLQLLLTAISLDDELEVTGVLTCHVDDFLWADSQYFSTSVIPRLKSAFHVGWKNFCFVGMNFATVDGAVQVHQHSYINNLQLLPMKAARAM